MTGLPDQARTPAPGEGTARGRPDPLAMTPSEKLAAEWEARHDVAARGSHPSAWTVQEYLGRTRTREALGRPAVRRAAPAADLVPSAAQPAAGGAQRVGGRHRRHWWASLRRR